MMRIKKLSVVLLGLAGLQYSAHAQAASPTPVKGVPSIDELQQEVENAVEKPKFYMGAKNGVIDDGRGTFCNKERSWSLFWKARVGDSQFIIMNDGTAVMRLVFDDSAVEASGYRKGGMACWWSGGNARLSLSRISIELKLSPRDGDEQPNVELAGLLLEGLRVDRVDLALPFLTWQNSSLPDWMAEYVENNINGYIAPWILQNFKATITKQLGQKIYKLLEYVRENGVGGT